MDNAKLKELVGDVLQDGLAEIAHKQPGDAVDYLGRYLLKWVAQDELEQEKAAKRAELAAALAAKQAAQAIVDVEKAALREAEDRKQAEAEDLLASVAKQVAEGSTDNHETAIYPKIFDLLQTRIGCGAYLWEKETTQTPPTLKCISAGSSSSDMFGKSLVGGEPEEQEGATWRAFDLVDQPDNEEGEPVEPILPDFVHVKNAMRDDAVKFFGIPKLGGYLMVPFTCKTGFETTTNEEGEEVTAATGEVQYALALNLIGKGRAFTQQEIDLAVACAETMQTLEEKRESEIPNKMAALEEQRAKVSEILEDAVLAAKDEAEEENFILKNEMLKEENEPKARIQKMERKLGQTFKDRAEPWAPSYIQQAVDLTSVYPKFPAPEIQAVLKSMFYMLGYTNEQLWESDCEWKMRRRSLFSADLVAKLQQYPATAAEARAVPEYATTAAVKDALMMGQANWKDVVDSVKPTGAQFGIFAYWTFRAIGLREGHTKAAGEEAELDLPM